jgi:hypothetical protein
MNKYDEIKKLVGDNKPAEVNGANLIRAEKLVRVIEEVENLKAELSAEIESSLTPIKNEVKQHRRAAEKMFAKVLNTSKKTSKSSNGLKNYQNQYLNIWRKEGFDKKCCGVDALRKAVGNYNKVQFQQRLEELVKLELVIKNELGKYLVTEEMAVVK